MNCTLPFSAQDQRSLPDNDLYSGASQNPKRFERYTVRRGYPYHAALKLIKRHLTEAGNKFHKAAAYNVVQGTRSFDLVGQRDEKIHSEQRKLVARAYSMDSMVHLEPNVDLVISQMVEQLDKINGRTIDLGLWLQLYAFGMWRISSMF
jgi:cytochrome P450